MRKFALLTAIAVIGSINIAFAQNNAVRSVEVYQIDGPPVAGTNQIETLTIGGTPTGGTFTITATAPVILGTISGLRATAPITWSATNATLLANINSALAAMNWSGAGGITATAGTVTAGIGTVLLTYGGILGQRGTAAPVPTLGVTNALTGTSPTVAVAITTPGVDVTFRSAKPGTLLEDDVTPGLYMNTSATINSPTWTQITVP
jgi:hypothetical protein